MKTILILDCNYLAHRSYHALGDLRHGQIGTAVIFGVMRDILSLQELFGTDRMVFCFDVGKAYRAIDYPGYKATRYLHKRERPDLQKQIRLLRKEVLPAIGYQNIFSQKGHEADDIIASLCLNLPKNREAIVVSADKDLYQVLGERVTIYNPQSKVSVNRQSFIETWGIEPEQWADAKAMAGCSTDEVEGIPGIKEKTAAKFLSNSLSPQAKAYAAIVAHNHIWRRNLPIVGIPYPGTKIFTIWRDEIDPKNWEAVMQRYGIRSLPTISTTRKAIKRK